jgi:predicted pyridoxine 5'-phosphate oxidase superfamily flavin-nucleotide-binding protein
MSDIYHDGNRTWQEKFQTRQLADRLQQVIVHEEVDERDRQFIEARDMFFISTVDDLGRPTVSYKGGHAGFVRVLSPREIAFPGYDGNGMFLTAGNIASGNDVGMLFVDFENPQRMRLHGVAAVHAEDPLLAEYPEAIYIVRVEVRNLFVNCPRYVHRYRKVRTSEFVPTGGRKTPQPEWKSAKDFCDVVPNDE